MDIFDKIKVMTMDDGVSEFNRTTGAVLVDVRSAEEYAQGHVPGSINVPTMEIPSFGKKVENKETPVFAYCLSGARSRRACALLISMGYTNVTNIGGITGYSGAIEK